MSRDVEFDENDVMRREIDEARAANVTLYATNKNLVAERDELLADAVAGETERCAKIAETWNDPNFAELGIPARIGKGCFNSETKCSAPAGIAAAIRALAWEEKP